jgi:diphthine synthase
VYLEAYTSILMVPQDRLVRGILPSNLDCRTDETGKEAFYGRPLIPADREMVELQSDEILQGADTEDVALLVVGDPFG